LNREIFQYQNQAKALVCRMTPTSPSRCSLIAGPYLFHYLLDRGVCYIILTDSQFSRTKAFAFLEAIQTEFYGKYYQQIQTVSRPYAFLDFDHIIHKTQKIYSDSRSSNLSQLNVALQDVQRIMVQNIDDVLQRGEALSSEFRFNELRFWLLKLSKFIHLRHMVIEQITIERRHLTCK
ncbi:vesicle transport protein SEC22, partial [Schistosoma bovis]